MMIDDAVFRTIEELETRYTLEPTITDLFVEGAFDVDVMKWYFKEKNLNHVKVYEVSTIKFPNHSNEKKPDEYGARGSILLLARYFEDRPDIGKQMLCVADADEAYIYGEVPTQDRLALTDYTSMEVYAYLKRPIENAFQLLIPKASPDRVEEIKVCLDSILQAAFSIRIAKKKLGLGGRKIPVSSFLSSKEFEIDFDCPAFVSAICKNAELDAPHLLQDAAKMVTMRFLPDPRFQIDGHDFATCFSWLVKKMYNYAITADNAGRALIMSAGIEGLKSEPMFKKVTDWANERAMVDS